MMTDGERLHEGPGLRAEQTAPVEDPEWVVAKSLLEVNDTCANTLQEFLLYSTTDRLDDLPAAELSDRIDDLIERQTRTIAELELAKEALAQLDDE